MLNFSYLWKIQVEMPKRQLGFHAWVWKETIGAGDSDFVVTNSVVVEAKGMNVIT